MGIHFSVCFSSRIVESNSVALDFAFDYMMMLCSTAARIDEILSMRRVGQLHLNEAKPYSNIVGNGNKIRTLYLLPPPCCTTADIYSHIDLTGKTRVIAGLIRIIEDSNR